MSIRAIVLAAMCPCVFAHAAQPARRGACPAAARPARRGAVGVGGSTPLPRIDVPKEHIPANVHAIDSATLRQALTISAPEALNRLPGVHVSHVQGSPFQADVQ